MKNKKKIISISIVVIVLLVLVGFTYGYFLMSDTQTSVNVINSSCLSVSITNDGDAISISDAVAVSDVEGMASSAYTFTITNSCDTSTNYQINLESVNESSSSIDSSYIKTSIQKESYGSIIKLLSEADSADVALSEGYEAHKLYSGVISGGSSISFNLRLWIDYDATADEAGNKTYQSKIIINANSEIVADTEYDITYTIDTDTGTGSATVSSTDTVSSVTYCTTDLNECTPSGSDISISSNSSNQMVCAQVNGSSEIYCSEPFYYVQSIMDIIATKTISTRDDFSTTLTTDTTGTVYSASDGMYGGTTYYWAGAATDNYVYFAGYYWRIVRINGDGSIRLIYDGTSAHDNGESSTDRYVGTSAFNPSYSYAYYVGYTYTASIQRPTTQNGGTSSTIKGVLDNWYSSNLSSYSSYLDTSGKFCNDRTSYSDESGTTTGWASTGTTYYYGAYIRLDSAPANYSPSFGCSATNDIYTTSIGLITADEVAFAGGVWGTSNSSYYLYTGSDCWTMSPFSFESLISFAFVFDVSSSGSLYTYYVEYAEGVRPVINLSSEVLFVSGDGTASSPYEISL